MQRGCKKALLLLLVMSLFLLSMLLTGCAQGLAFQGEPGIDSAESSVVKQKLIIAYYITREGNYLVPVRVKVPDDDNFARHVVEKLLAGSQDQELLASAFPVGVVLRDVYVKNGIACVDLGGDVIKTMDPKVWRRAVDSLVLTLTELPDGDISSVEILVNGVSDDILLERPAYVNIIAGGPDDGLTTTVYFSYNDTYLVPVTIKLEPNISDPLFATLEQLVAGPQGIPYLSRVFAEGTRFLGYQKEGDLIRLNFSREAVELDTKGNIRKDEQSPTILALAMTLHGFSGLDRFQILIEGQPLPDLNYPIGIPQSYLDREWIEPLLDIPGAQPT
ncbi:MAG: GerMN domain-containing protein [Firmicutes bacterium]|jgi:spore germination protein GerM|nr:GerMN domain-containing protein [Bacillota bacterium]